MKHSQEPSRASRTPRANSLATTSRSISLGSISPDVRVIYCNNQEANHLFKYVGNSVTTTKYTFLTFLPKGLYEQFRRFANIYFLMITLLSFCYFSPVSAFSNVAPMVIVMLFSLLKEGYEDLERRHNDKAMNNNLVDVLQGQHWVPVPWKELQVGDVVRVKQDEFFPSDIFILASTNPDGVCYIETANLDGETNMKIRKAAENTWDFLNPEDFCEFKGEIQCEQPNNSLYTFTGNLMIPNETVPINPNQILLRGCSLRNTEYITGVVIFTGHETKVMMNATKVPSKRSTLEKKLDKVIFILFGLLIVMVLIGAIGSQSFMDFRLYYLALQEVDTKVEIRPDAWYKVFEVMGTLAIVYSPVIPISLYVSIEVIKVFQSKYINRDLNMYHAESDTPAMTRTSNLTEELGQVEYIFSDKTGTLTRNLMEFFKCTIQGEIYGTGITEIERGNAKRNGVQLKEDVHDNSSYEKGFNFNDARLMKGAWRNEPKPDACKEFFRCLAICHTVLPEGEESPEEIKYQAASPDEAALVVAAKNFGFFFFRRTPNSIWVRESHAEKFNGVEDVSYEILNVLEFNSTRKRQSVVCRYPDGRLVLYCKGADTVIYERLADKNNECREANRDHLEQFGAAGLRTLCLAYRNLSSDEYESWNEKFSQAKSSLTDREKKLDEVSELIETNLTLIGSTAIEDKLQQGVPDCIETLAKAGIKIWVLTGDKMETAINIAYACNLVDDDMKQFLISADNEEIYEVESKGNQAETTRFIREEVKKGLKQSLEEACGYSVSDPALRLALIIDGKCLMHALDPSLKEILLDLGLKCSAVVCCRVSPLQKALVTSMVRTGAQKITLGIGDGANDVSMIQAAHIGIGISGQEGMQAVMASDFAIAQFRFLSDLLLVHGRWSYFRICKVVTYFFYKNLAFTLTQFWFNFHNGFSGQTFYESWLQTSYNVLFTSLPVGAIGIFDKDVRATLSKQYPELYGEGIRNVFFRWRVLARWLISSIYQSLVFFYSGTFYSHLSQSSTGKIFDLWAVSTLVFTCVVITVNLCLLLISSTITKWHFLGVGGSILTWFLFAFVYTSIPYGTFSFDDRPAGIVYVMYDLISTTYFYATIILVPTIALFGDFIYQGVQRWFFPYDYQIVQEIHKYERIENTRAGSLEKGKTFATPKSSTMAKLPRRRHTGFAFDSPGYESFFASQFGVKAPQKAWDVIRKASTKTPRRPRFYRKKGQ